MILPIFLFNLVKFDKRHDISCPALVYLQGTPHKCPYFPLTITFTKSKETFKIFFLQILEVYRIFLVQTTLESIIFYHTFSETNDMFDQAPRCCMAGSSNSNIKIVHNSIHHFLWNLSDFSSSDVVFESLCCVWIIFINSIFQVPPRKKINNLGQKIWNKIKKSCKTG